MVQDPCKATARANFVKRESNAGQRLALRHAIGSGLKLGVLATAIAYGCHAQAQSITGGLHGQVPATAGVSVQVTRADIGFAKAVPVKDGRYSLDYLNPGLYQVNIAQNGTTLGQYTVQVVANTSVNVPTPQATSNASAKTLATVTVDSHYLDTVTNPIDVSTPELSTVYSAELLHDLPVNQTNIDAVALLNSNVRSAGGYPQVAGNSPSENRYYYNEFDTTYDVTGLGKTGFPQEAVQSTQFIPGSGNLSWTSTTGGVTSATLRQGTNTFHFGYDVYYYPGTSTLLNARAVDTYNSQGNYELFEHANSTGAYTQQYAWLSGPIVKDKLFFYLLLGDQPPYSYKQYSPGNSDVTRTSARGKDALVNITWDITKNQSLNVAGYKNWNTSSTYTYNMTNPYEPSTASSQGAWNGYSGPYKMLIGNYHWQITDDLSMRAMAGDMRQDAYYVDAKSGDPFVENCSATTYICSMLYGGVNDYYAPTDTTYQKQGIKLEFNWNLGDHQLTFGGEKYENSYHYEPMTNPNGNWVYEYGAQDQEMGNGSPVPANGQYVISGDFSAGGNFRTFQKGYYLFDTWQALPHLVIQAGARLDQMRNDASTGASFLQLNTLSPRLGAAWDVHGDSTMKIGANLGNYTLPMPSFLAYKVATSVVNTATYYSYTGMNPTTSVPTGLQQVGPVEVVTDGAMPNPVSLASRNLKNTHQYELQLYLQQQLTSSWSLLAQTDVHELKDIVEQTDDQSGTITDYVRTHGYPNYPGLLAGRIQFNPGRSIVLEDNLLGNGTMEDITIPNSYLNMPPPKRRYYDFTFSLQHSRTQDEPYVITVNYTWTHLYGNVDGYTNLTEAGGAYGGNVSGSVWPGYSGVWGLQPFTAGFTGPLTGDIRNALKVSGVYYWNNGLRLGSVFNAHTGEPFSCVGTVPDPNNLVTLSWGAWSHYCSGKLVPEGSTWRAPFFWQLDLDLGYDLNLHGHKLSFDLNVSNVTNRQSVTSRVMQTDTGVFSQATNLPVPNPYYYAINSLQLPRSTTVSVRYSF
ncbi:TonB-dependent receptor [Dyella mobilis]|uniref:TonB-dependent receptor n=1 Tax=Dyella mobilis TaxID=1849582 RepID=A0ABS2KJ11_9GAMM|nr:TonB-dependent receptor [Dyella mobilis]MBM7131131.1 TonB-dependent receptor [Dyella mobilis]GLQ98935.1 Oar protein [Dyella mobilis]